jgi:leucyl/phenylalanyl-tRNA--protein transferase
VETWVDGQLVGGLYFVAHRPHVFWRVDVLAPHRCVSKIALAALVAPAGPRGVPLIDCQQNTRHLASLGARRGAARGLCGPCGPHEGVRGPADWTYDESAWDLLESSLPGQHRICQP